MSAGEADVSKDIRWVEHPATQSIELLGQGKVDAFMGFPPQPQDLRARKIGYVLVNSNVDRPWSTYFCCMLAGNCDFVRAHPIATKRALRAILEATDVCSMDRSRRDNQPPTPADNCERIAALEQQTARLEFQLERLVEMVNRHQHDLDIQRQRIGEIQADLDAIRSAWTSTKGARKGK